MVFCGSAYVVDLDVFGLEIENGAFTCEWFTTGQSTSDLRSAYMLRLAGPSRILEKSAESGSGAVQETRRNFCDASTRQMISPAE